MNIRLFIKGLFFIGLTLSLLITQSAWGLTPNPSQNSDTPEIAKIQQKGILTAAVYNGNLPPFFMHDAAGNWSGIEIDIANMIAKELGVKLIIKPCNTFDDVINVVAHDQADIGIGLLSSTPERSLKVKFTHPLYTFEPALAVNRLMLSEHDWSINDAISQIQSSTSPVKIGALAYSTNVNLAKTVFPKAEVETYSSINDALEAVANGNVFAAAIDTPAQVQSWLDHHPESILKIDYTSIPNQTGVFAIAVPWENVTFAKWLNTFIDYPETQEAIAQIFKKYDVKDNTP